MIKYLPAEIEPKWQKIWKESKIYQIDLEKAENPYYVLVEFTYPSGDLHIGHWFAFTIPDIFARFKRMQGFSVFLPNGFDAFGLPAENAAIKRNIHPKDWTYANIERMKGQFGLMGAMHNWEHTLNSCDPEYYKWNQWIFLKMLEKGLAYKGKYLSNFCPKCQTVLANENVEAGKCWRCGSEVEQKEVEQWFLKITDYADRLIWSDPPIVDWPKPIREGQNNWIGKSKGLVLDFEGIRVFTTRPETTDGATFLVLAPEHPQVSKLTTNEQKNQVEAYLKKVGGKSIVERKENKEKTGVFTGSYVLNPVSNKKIAVWVADYVLLSYGTGAIMAVPAADERDKEFAQKFDLPVIKTSFKANPKGEEQVNYHLHDWSISRSRYWGTPIPIIYCDQCGTVPVPFEDLPVELPYKVDYAPKGKPPRATAEDWMKVACPECNGAARREAETMDTFFDSSWYFLRYLDSKNTEQIFNKERLAKWIPLNIYFGGAEHTLGHTLYSRFFVKFFKDLGLLDASEYALKRVHHGVILGPDGARMSKSKGNVVNPDEQVEKYGADAVRTYLAFLGPYDLVTPWNPAGISGVYRFLERVWNLQAAVKEDIQTTPKDLKVMYKTIKKVAEDLEAVKFNTPVAALMEWLNHLTKKGGVSMEEYKTFLILLSPFAPHMTEELWAILGENNSIHLQKYPQFEARYLEEDTVVVVVQINGKAREQLKIDKNMIEDQVEVERLAISLERVQKFLNEAKIEKTIYIPGKILNLVIK